MIVGTSALFMVSFMSYRLSISYIILLILNINNFIRLLILNIILLVLQGHRFAKVYECEKYFFLEFVKANVREKKLKTKLFVLFIYSKRQIWLN